MNILFKVLNFVQSEFSNSFNLTQTDRLILINLSSFTGNNETCWPSLKTLSGVCHIKERHLTERLKHLSVQKLVYVLRNPGKRSEYKLNSELMQSSILKEQNRTITEQKDIHNPCTEVPENLSTPLHHSANNPCTPVHENDTYPHPIPLIYKSNYKKAPNKQPAQSREARSARLVDVGFLLSILPEWIDKDKWTIFLQNRKRLRLGTDETVQKIITDDLLKMKEEGYDIDQIINTTIVNGWKGFFRPKGESYGKQKFENPYSSYAKGEIFEHGYDRELDPFSDYFNQEKYDLRREAMQNGL